MISMTQMKDKGITKRPEKQYSENSDERIVSRWNTVSLFFTFFREKNYDANIFRENADGESRDILY